MGPPLLHDVPVDHDFLDPFEAGQLDRDVVAVVRFQGPAANGMPELHNNLGAALQKLEHWDEAEACFRRAVELDPRNVEAIYNLALVDLREKKTEAALATTALPLMLYRNRFGTIPVSVEGLDDSV